MISKLLLFLNIYFAVIQAIDINFFKLFEILKMVVAEFRCTAIPLFGKKHYWCCSKLAFSIQIATYIVKFN